jgi:hypothetical protein
MDKEHKIASLRNLIGVLENAINQMNESEKTASSPYANDLRKLKKKKGEELRRLLQKKGGTHNKHLVKSMKKKNTEHDDDFELLNRSISVERKKQQKEQEELKDQERRKEIMSRKVSMHHYKTKGHLPNVSEHSEMNIPVNIGGKRKTKRNTKTRKNRKSRKSRKSRK